MSDWMRRNIDLYPKNWGVIAKATKDAKGWICEACDRRHHPPKFVITVDHLDHNPGNCSEENLLVLCRRDHLRRQGLWPRPVTREEALKRLRKRVEVESQQLVLFG